MAALTLLQLAQEFCRRRSLPIPGTVTGAQDDTTRQVWGLLNEGISELADRFEWQQLRTRFTFAHANSTGYTALDLSENNATLPDYKAMLNRTLWDTLGRREVFGPFDPFDWEILLNLQVSQAVYNFAIFGNALRIYPVPPAPIPADQFSMEYISNFGVLADDLTTPTLFFNSDASICRMPSGLMLQDLKWRWNQAKGLAYAEDFRTFEGMVVNLQGRDPAPTITMDQTGFEKVAAPGLLVAAGNWPLP